MTSAFTSARAATMGRFMLPFYRIGVDIVLEHFPFPPNSVRVRRGRNQKLARSFVHGLGPPADLFVDISFRRMDALRRELEANGYRDRRSDGSRQCGPPPGQTLAAFSPSASKSSAIEVMTSVSYSPG
jgi:hypothetical protein